MNVWLSQTSVPGSEERRERVAKTKHRLNLSTSVCALKWRTIPPASYTTPASNNNRAGASGPAGPVLAGPILREKVGVFISRLHVGVAARAIVT